jgi:hypothetical protein
MCCDDNYATVWSTAMTQQRIVPEGLTACMEELIKTPYRGVVDVGSEAALRLALSKDWDTDFALQDGTVMSLVPRELITTANGDLILEGSDTKPKQSKYIVYLSTSNQEGRLYQI